MQYRVTVHLLDGSEIQTPEKDAVGNPYVHVTPSGVFVYEMGDPPAEVVDRSRYEFLPWHQIERLTSRKIPD